MKRKNYPPQSSLLRFIASVLFLAVSTFTWAYYYDFTVNGIYYYSITNSSVAVMYGPSGGNSYSGSIVIPSRISYNSHDYDVVKIGDDAFYKCGNMTSITIPSSVTSIGERAFYGCTGLTSITLPANLKTIGQDAFYS